MDLPRLWLLCLLPLAAYLQDRLLENPQQGVNAEFYVFHGVTYGLYLDKVAFTEARLLCRSKQGSLVEFHEESVALFIGRALAESAVGFSSLWIGGVYTIDPDMPRSAKLKPKPPEVGIWKWLSGENIVKEPIGKRTVFPMNVLPYWLDRPNLTVTYPQCLVVDRNNHFQPAITGETCNSLRPFICALPTENYAGGPIEVLPPIELDKKTYHLFQGRSTWVEALRFCRNLSYQLAVVTTANEFDKLQRRMRRARPVMENAWIGGVFLDGRWMWATNNEDVSTSGVGNDSGVVSPPWHRLEGEVTDGCLLADRHMCGYFAYVEAKCDRRRSFVCELPSAQVERQGLMRIPNSSMWLSTIQLGWEDAQKMCSKCLEGGLMQLWFFVSRHLEQQMKDVFTAMTQSGRADIRHIWLNGFLTSQDVFVWGSDRSWDAPAPEKATFGGTPVSFHNSLNPKQWNFSSGGFNRRGEEGYILFCPGDLKGDPSLKEFKCLNMDRENMKHYFMYGLKCDVKQHFICMVYGESKSGMSFYTSNASRLHLTDACKDKELDWPGI